jgi:hypothetical protein
MGDWRQTLPIVKYAETEEVISACLKRSPYWKRILKLQINMRLSQFEKRIQTN